MDYNLCSQILTREIDLLDSIALIQNDVRNAVINRQWIDFEDHSANLDAVGLLFESLEEERIIAFDRQTNWTHFYTAVSYLPDEERQNLTLLYRNLKLKTFKIRATSDALGIYLNEAKNTVTAFIGAAFPDRRGRLYGRTGAQIPIDMRSMVLDTSV
jgi:hypothetical protein